MKIAFAVQHDLVKPNTSSDDWLIKAELEKLGIEVDVIDWRDSRVDLNKYDSIFVSSTWNAAVHSDEFIAWMKRCEVGKKRLINDIEVLLLGLHKDKYLTLLEKQFGDVDSSAGSITPSAYIKPDDKEQSFTTVRQELQQKGGLWQGNMVIKPIISAIGMNTYLITDDQKLLKKPNSVYRSFEEAEAIVQKLVHKKGSRGVIIQPFMPAVETSGEYQLIFIENKFSHAIVKPKGFGNRSSAGKKPLLASELPEGMLEFAERIMQFYAAKFPSGVTRARFDLFAGEKGPILCEAEVVEPHTNIRRLATEQQKTVISQYAQALIKRTNELSIQNCLKADAQQYFSLLNNPVIAKAVMKICATNDNILNYLSTSSTKDKHDLATDYAPVYMRSCLDALNGFANRNGQGKAELIKELDEARNEYSKSVLEKDTSTSSMVVRLLLKGVVNFIAALTLGVAHYINYQKTGTATFFADTASDSKLKRAHHDLNKEIESLPAAVI